MKTVFAATGAAMARGLKPKLGMNVVYFGEDKATSPAKITRVRSAGRVELELKDGSKVSARYAPAHVGEHPPGSWDFIY